MIKTITPLFLTLFFLTNQFATGQTAPAAPSNGFPSRIPPPFSIPKTSPKTSPLPPKSLPIPSTSNSSNDNPASSPSSGLPIVNPQLPNIPTFPTPPINRPSNTLPPTGNALPSNPRPSPTVWLDPHNNKALPIEVECDIAHLLVLKDTPAVTADGSTPFAVVATVYTSLLNLFATDAPSQAIMYTDNVKPFIEQHADRNGNYFYTTIPGSESTLLGYSHCLSATPFRDVLCKDQNTLFTLDANVDSNQQTYFWVHFTTVFLTAEDNSDNEMTHYQWINDTGIGDYYDFYFTKDHPDLSQVIPNSSALCVRSLTANIWVGSRDITSSTHNWTVTGNKAIGLSTSTDGNPFVLEVPADSPSPAQQPEEPAQLPDNSNQPVAPEKKNYSGSSWEDFQQNGAGSAWEAYLQKSSTQANNSPSNQNQGSVAPNSSAAPTPSTSSDNNSSQQNSPPLDKETKAKIELAVQLYKEGKSLEQIASATGFTEAQLNYIFSHFSQ